MLDRVSDDRQWQVFEDARSLRAAIRKGDFAGPTAGQAPDFLQCNLAILPQEVAADFHRFCTANPKPCPLVAVGEPGDPSLPSIGEDIDIRFDVPSYRVFENGEHTQSVTSLADVWRDDLVVFALGCSLSFEGAIRRAGIRIAHAEGGSCVAMYRTNIETVGAGPFGGPMVVSMRPFAPRDAIAATVLSNRYPLAHGAPVHIGDPAQIGIADLFQPDFGDVPTVSEGEIPVFWACGVTPQSAIRSACPDLAIVHEPGSMLVTDLPVEGAN